LCLATREDLVDDLLLREATSADVPTLAALVREAFAEYHGRLDPPSGAHNETEDKIRTRLATAHATLASRAGLAVGCIFYELEVGYLYFSRLSVLPAHRRRGVGRELINYVETRARTLGLAGVRMGVRVALRPLHAYYDRLGYRLLEYRTHPGYAEPTYIILEKDLRHATVAEETDRA
jgi:predicted N-acetyltransferase YhbS